MTLDVIDHGPGMTPEQAHRVFERFYRADQARTRATGGSGLGLAIVRALVTAHGGVASVRTAPGQGATFRIALPLAPEAQGGMAADDDPDLDESGEAYETATPTVPVIQTEVRMARSVRLALRRKPTWWLRPRPRKRPTWWVGPAWRTRPTCGTNPEAEHREVFASRLVAITELRWPALRSAVTRR